MPPSAIEVSSQPPSAPNGLKNGNALLTGLGTTNSFHYKPMKVSGLLDSHIHVENTPIIGREYPDVQISDLIASPKRDEYIRDLAITVSERGVVFFRKQTGLTAETQKNLADLLGVQSGRPAQNGLHIHPLMAGKQEVGFNKKNEVDKNINVISSRLSAKFEGQKYGDRYRLSSGGWHSDMTFENMPSDYAVLKMSETPPSGGDTLWASAYEVYDRLSTPMQKFLEALTATHDNPSFIDQAARLNFHIHPGPRGAPENTGTDLIASHPVIRTNPVTGWKSVYSCHGQTQRINELTAEESEDILKHLNRLTYENHDLQVRLRWGVDDVAIWDNRCTFHTATKDLDGSGPRTGNRSASMGERPFMDPSSSSRREALAMTGS